MKLSDELAHAFQDWRYESDPKKQPRLAQAIVERLDMLQVWAVLEAADALHRSCKMRAGTDTCPDCRGTFTAHRPGCAVVALGRLL